MTQFWVKKLSPTSKRRRCSLVRLRADNSNAFEPAEKAVVVPPKRSSKISVRSRCPNCGLHAIEPPTPKQRTTTAATMKSCADGRGGRLAHRRHRYARAELRARRFATTACMTLRRCQSQPGPLGVFIDPEGKAGPRPGTYGSADADRDPDGLGGAHDGVRLVLKSLDGLQHRRTTGFGVRYALAQVAVEGRWNYRRQIHAALNLR